ncbi:hypothetical protein CVD25_14885 [Bacillus canaveralius]|uniref:Uncharacterized protein n=1 Tax=Bacillus canaveralius TaxID=1403243 RepID=A0A2N5GMW8_9BACI|nr:hypothetical protein [Bacillus canaveralius]PLR83471.1 hypothetical protein CU635_09250 [Bacillus canaveralius]PLR95348.1 hypothetical protein CVD25_14885 [Bacillus canaveralius]
MLNSSLKKDAIEKLKNAVAQYKRSSSTLQNNAVKLHNTRTYGVNVIRKVEEYINTLANTPKEFEKSFDQVRVNLASFKALSEISYDEKEMIKLAGGGAAAGVAAGVATAALAPTAAMAIATTFGTAATGTAISTLSGAAATNAALAWLGGGALAAGGGGMAGGSALLALAGPIGWGIGAASLAAGGFFASNKNKEAAIKADNERVEIVKATRVLDATSNEINNLKSSTQTLATNLEQSLISFISNTTKIKSFTDFSQDERNLLRAIINNTENLSALFMKEVGK